MNIDLSKRIEEYLLLDTNYAIILTGDYGIGKTHYLRHELFPLVENITVPDDKSKDKYEPILISLFGVSSIEEIHDKVFLELFPILKRKDVQFIAGLGSSVLKRFSGESLGDFLKSTNSKSSNVLSYGKILLCLDDIDRKSKDIDLKEVYGFVNDLVENLGAKILLIANEDELKKEFEDNLDGYALIREKVIGVSLSFSADVDKVFRQIIESKYKKSEPSYYNFLQSNETAIVQRIVQNRSNIRNLLFFTEHFKVVYRGLEERIFKEEGLNSVRDEIYHSILNFTLPIAIEYKLGRLNSKTFDDIRHLYKGSFLSFSDIMKGPKDNDLPKSYFDTFKENYIDGVNMRRVYFDSVFNYVIGNAAFDADKLIEELKKSYSVQTTSIPDWEIALGELSYWKCVNLSSSEYRRLNKILLRAVDQGQFRLEQYPTVFHFVTRFDNLLNLNIDKLIKRFKKGIKKGTSGFSYERNLRMRISVHPDKEFFSELKEIVDYCAEINEHLLSEIQREKTDLALDLYQTDFLKFLETIQDDRSDIRSRPFFYEIEFGQFWRQLRKLKNSDLIDMAFYLNERYRLTIYEKLFPEQEFVLNLISSLERRIKLENDPKLTIATYNFMLGKLKEVVKNFPVKD
ncbi:MAG: hypothetical protein ACJA1C_001978 [Crocinitomicaceae bacterium]|jgi:hypothetical protein